MNETAYRRRLVLIVAIAAGLAVLAIGATFARPAKAEPAAPVCVSLQAAHELYNLIREGRGVPGVPLVIVGVAP